MGIFGMFLNVVSGGVLLGETLHNYSLDNEYKQNAINKGIPTWTDSKGKTYLTSTGEQVYNGVNGTLKSVKTGRVVYDFKKESAKNCNREQIENATAKGKEFAFLTYPEFNYKRYATELSTMKRFYLSTTARYAFCGNAKYYKYYYQDGKATCSKYSDAIQDKEIEITVEEYDSLGGSGFDNDYKIYY